MKLNVACTRTSDSEFAFEFTNTGARYRGTAAVTFDAAGKLEKINVAYSEPRNEVASEKMREAFDPYIIEEILRVI